MELKSSPKKFENYKSDTPENTIKNIEKGFERLGLELEYFSNKDIAGLDVFKGCCGIKNIPIHSYGKGITPILSKASAYAEMAERVSSGNFLNSLKNLSQRKDLFCNVKLDEEALDQYKYFKFGDGYSYEKKSDNIRSILPEQFVPLHSRQQKYLNVFLNANVSKYHWVRGYSLSRNEKVRIPIKFVSKISGTNGLAAGNTFEETITQGLCEVFERYCYFQVMHSRIPVPTVDLDTIKNSKIRKQISFYNDHNIQVIVKDFSLRRRFPVVAVLFIDHNIKKDQNLLKKDIFFQQVNAGAALDLEEAVLRCFTERRQLIDSRENLFLYSKADTIWKHWVLNLGKSYNGASAFRRDFLHYLTCDDLSFLMDEKSEMVSFNDLKKAFHCYNDFYNDVKEMLNICHRENKELIVVNTQHPKIKFPSVWVIVPDMMCLFEALGNENSVFSNYSLEDAWFENSNSIKAFIKKTEDYLSYNLYYPEINTVFGSELSLFRLLAIANLKILNYDEALKYFIAAKELEKVSKFDSIIERLKTPDKKLIQEALALKNPFVYGWDFEEKARNEFIIPREVNRVLSCFLSR